MVRPRRRAAGPRAAAVEAESGGRLSASPPSALAKTPPPPYYAAVFTSRRTAVDDGYGAMADRMVELASQQPGFLGVESARGADGVGITVSYWSSLEAIAAWKANAEHRVAQLHGRSRWYEAFELRICRVERAYRFP